MTVVDLRSDTVTKPTTEMRRAMAEAKVGDDVYGEDPTTNSLQERVAELFGKDAALFVTSGSMGNLISFRCHTEPGDEVICHEGAHFLHFEVGSLAAVAGVQVRPLSGNRGVLDPDDVIAAIRPRMYAFPRSRVIALENTNNFAGGAIYPIDDLRAARKVADEYGLALHIDGARIFNASVATGIPVSEYAALADTLTFCFSKGLCCPVGSVLVGSHEIIEKARRYRQMHGGGMRQSGILTAACHVALDSMIDRLAEDHANAKRLAEGIAAIQPEAINLGEVDTNLVLVTTAPFGFTPAEFSAALKDEGVLFAPHATGFVRLAVHADVTSRDIEFVLEKVQKVVASAG